MDGQSILVRGAGLRGFGAPRLSAGYESFRRHDGNRRNELRTGLNYVAAASDQAQSGTDTAEIVAEVKKTCAQVPSQSLASAVWTTYLEFKKR